MRTNWLHIASRAHYTYPRQTARPQVLNITSCLIQKDFSSNLSSYILPIQRIIKPCTPCASSVTLFAWIVLIALATFP
jgi:hypothetical protein